MGNSLIRSKNKIADSHNLIENINFWDIPKDNTLGPSTSERLYSKKYESFEEQDTSVGIILNKLDNNESPGGAIKLLSELMRPETTSLTFLLYPKTEFFNECVFTLFKTHYSTSILMPVMVKSHYDFIIRLESTKLLSPYIEKIANEALSNQWKIGLTESVFNQNNNWPPEILSIVFEFLPLSQIYKFFNSNEIRVKSISKSIKNKDKQEKINEEEDYNDNRKESQDDMINLFGVIPELSI